MKKAVFFDRDGTLNVDVHYLHRVEDFIWINGAKEAIKYCNDLGFLTIVITNQSGIARGYYDATDVKKVFNWMNKELSYIGAKLDDIFYCPHHINGIISTLAMKCNCRKPNTGLVVQAKEKYDIDLSKSFFVGDMVSDMLCAKNAGIKGIKYSGGSLLECVRVAMQGSVE